MFRRIKDIIYFLIPNSPFLKRKLLLRHLKPDNRESWLERIDAVGSDPNNQFIPRVKDAGKIKGGYLILHNGLKVNPLSYCGYPMLRLLKENKGVHEPQEERIFKNVLNIIPEGGLILELGAYWAFYSCWFLKSIKGASAILVEPSTEFLNNGVNNMRLNSFENFITINSFVSSEKSSNENKINVHTIFESHKIYKLDVLHCDIQGYEYEMLQGASIQLDQALINFVFISTHSDELHKKCIEFLKSKKYRIEVDIDLQDTYAHDGLIVAANKKYDINYDVLKKSDGCGKLESFAE